MPTAGHPPSKGLPTERQRTWSALILSNPATAGDRTTLPSESYIDAQKDVITEQPLGIYEGFSKNLRLSPSQRCACLMETKEIWRLAVNRVFQASSFWVGSEETAEHGSDVTQL